MANLVKFFDQGPFAATLTLSETAADGRFVASGVANAKNAYRPAANPMMAIP
jgi:hypothetical protein